MAEGSAMVGAEAAPTTSVFLSIEKNINNHIASIARSPELPRMVAIREDAPTRGELTVQAACDSHREALHTLAEAPLVLRLGNQMDVVRLHAELHDAKKASFRRTDLRKNTIDERLAAQTGKPVSNPNRDMQRLVPAHLSAQMRNPSAPAAGFAASAFAPAAPCIAKGKPELRRHLNSLRDATAIFNH